MLPPTFNWEGSLEEVTQRATAHVEKILLENTLRDCTWNKTRAAEKLAISPKALLTKLRDRQPRRLDEVTRPLSAFVSRILQPNQNLGRPTNCGFA